MLVTLSISRSCCKFRDLLFFTTKCYYLYIASLSGCFVTPSEMALDKIDIKCIINGGRHPLLNRLRGSCREQGTADLGTVEKN